MTTEDYITLFIFFSLGWWAGSKLTAALHRSIMRDLLTELGVTPDQLRKVQDRMRKSLGLDEAPEAAADEPDHDVVKIKIEKHHDTLYAFRKDNDQFLGQGTTIEGLIERMGEKLRNTRCVVEKEDGAELIGNDTKWHYNIKSKQLSKDTE